MFGHQLKKINFTTPLKIMKQFRSDPSLKNEGSQDAVSLPPLIKNMLW
jgi:hypothetical protein